MSLLEELISVLREHERNNGLECQYLIDPNDLYYAKITCTWIPVSPYSKIRQEFYDVKGRTILFEFDIPYMIYIMISPLEPSRRNTIENHARELARIIDTLLTTLTKLYKEEGWLKVINSG